ncbi:hypothetical protein OEA41_008696 [Lepraria neglecta]|uniref:Uncharacterized protein n=1 Tax=Lepraria neglecta TaxID=209136 RepID=A0AAD9Z4H7_9LECA|nr:hypothetical protein OEA41_008696 [Lepraria neglecta]
MGDIEFVLPDHERKIKSAQKCVQSIRHTISRTRQTHALLRSVITPPLIADNVQIIYDTYYQPGQWDFSPKDPEVICQSIGRSCEQAIDTRLDELRRSILPNSQQTSSSSASDLVASTTTQNLNEAGSVNPLDVRQGKRHRRNTSENEAGHKRARGSGENKAGFVDQDGQDDIVVTDKIIKKIRKGLKDLKVKDGVYFPPVPNTNESQQRLDLPDGVNNHLSAQISISVAWEGALWEQTVAAKVASNQYIWYLRLLASYFFLLRTSIIERDNISWQDTVSISASSVRNRVMWRKAASMVNSIILGLSSSSGWGSKAYLVIQALAGK